MLELFGTSPFEKAAPYYDAHRAPYPPAALDYIISAFALSAGARVLDLGCGPGTIAIPLSRTGAEVVAVDRDAVMLGEARRLASERRGGRLRWLCARVEDVLPDLGRFQLVTLGQSLHWMDRDFRLRQLADVVEDGGRVGLLDDGRRRPPEGLGTTSLPAAAKY